MSVALAVGVAAGYARSGAVVMDAAPALMLVLANLGAYFALGRKLRPALVGDAGPSPARASVAP
jgi:hypothetical protein